MARKVPEINASSQADIAFLLLIFYLVSTTMNVDSGIYRMLPPWVEKQEENKVNERNVLLVFVSANDALMVDGKRMDNIADLKDKVREFFVNANDDPNKPEKVMRDIPLLGELPVTKGVVSLQNDRQTSYEMYIKVQNELARVVNELRDEFAQNKFNKSFEELTKEEKDAVQKAVPNAVSEAEPRENK